MARASLMSRFSNLEFGDESYEQSPRQKGLVKDEGYYFAEARSAFESGNFESALRLYSKVLEFNPVNVDAWTGQVRMLVELGEFREARLWADKALERFPHDPELLAAKAVALGREGDPDGALAFSDASIEERGDTPYIWLARGDVLLSRKEPRADFCFEKALSLAPGDWFIAWLAARIRSTNNSPWPSNSCSRPSNGMRAIFFCGLNSAAARPPLASPVRLATLSLRPNN